MKHYVYAMGAILCWASLPAATGSGLAELSTEELMFFSFSAAAVFLYVQDILLKKSFSLYIPEKKAILIGIWGIFFYHYVYYTALSHAPLAEGGILAMTWSLWIVIFSSILLFKKLKLSILLTGLIGMFGAGMVIAAGKELSFDRQYLLGYGLALGCGLIWSSFSVALNQVKIRREPMTTFTILAAILSTFLYIATMPHTMPSPQALAAACYLGCVPLGLSFFLWNRAVSKGNMVIIGFLSYLAPPLSVLLVALVHKEEVSSQVLMGMAVIIAASIGGRLCLSRAKLPSRQLSEEDTHTEVSTVRE